VLKDDSNQRPLSALLLGGTLEHLLTPGHGDGDRIVDRHLAIERAAERVLERLLDLGPGRDGRHPPNQRHCVEEDARTRRRSEAIEVGASRESSSPASLNNTKRGNQTAVTGMINTAKETSVRTKRAHCGS
jgi:hypothetical protein